MKFSTFLAEQRARQPVIVVLRMKHQVADEFEYLMVELPHGSGEEERVAFGDWVENRQATVRTSIMDGLILNIAIDARNMPRIRELMNELEYWGNSSWGGEHDFRTRPFNRMIQQLQRGINLFGFTQFMSNYPQEWQEAVLANPNDKVQWLVFADWLEEHNDKQRIYIQNMPPVQFYMAIRRFWKQI